MRQLKKSEKAALYQVIRIATQKQLLLFCLDLFTADASF